MRRLWIFLVVAALLACTSHQLSSAVDDPQSLTDLATKPGEKNEPATKVAAQDPPLPLTGEAAEEFLKTAEIISLEEFDTKGITKPRKATLTDGQLKAKAVFKTVDNVKPKEKLTTGRTILNLKDSFKHEIAAYELDKLLGLGIVPPTVERKIRRDTGSLSMWVNGTMTEWHRSKVKKLTPPPGSNWNEQMFTVRLFMQLTWDTDYNNISNLLIDADWKIWKIDSSRGFQRITKLRREGSLEMFSRSILMALKNLTRERMDEKLGPWLTTPELDSLWARRTRILELAQERIEESGEAAVLYD